MTATLAILLMAPPQGGGTNPIGLLLPWILVFGIFYFIWFRPQQRERAKHDELLKNLKKGDEVVTAGGIVGEVIHIKETMKEGQPLKAMDDRITIKSGESRLVIERGRIARVITAKTETTAS
jgi:preprotein translocase subunit YajC